MVLNNFSLSSVIPLNILTKAFHLDVISLESVE